MPNINRSAGYRSLALKLLLGGVVGTGVLLAAEGVLHRVYGVTGSIFSHRTPHPVLGWSLEPGASIMYRTAEFRVSVQYNSKGWRDVEHEYDNPSGNYRVLILGDSFMEAYSVPLESSFARRLEAGLSKKGRNVEVINLGVGGYGTLQEWLAFANEGVKYRPDLVLLGFYTNNDVLNNSPVLQRGAAADTDPKVRSRPFLDPSSSTWQVVPPDFAAAQKAFYEALGRAPSGSFGPVGYVKQTAVYGLLRDVRWTFAFRRQGAEESKSSPGADPANDIYRCELSPEYVEAWHLTSRIIGKLATDVRAFGAELVVFSVPSLPEVQHDGYSDVLCLEDPPSNTRLPRLLARNSVQYIDLLPAFRHSHEGGDYLFWRSDLHWTEEGHALAAGLVVEELQKVVPLDAPP